MIDENKLIEDLKQLRGLKNIRSNSNSVIHKLAQSLFNETIRIINEQPKVYLCEQNNVKNSFRIYVHCKNCRYLRNKGTFSNSYYCIMKHCNIRHRDIDKKARTCNFFLEKN